MILKIFRKPEPLYVISPDCRYAGGTYTVNVFSIVAGEIADWVREQVVSQLKMATFIVLGGFRQPAIPLSSLTIHGP